MLLALVAFIFILNSTAQTQFLYWKYWYFDMPMHFLGGVFLGFLAIYVLVFIFKKPVISKKYLFIFQVFLFVLVLSIAWELYEFFIDHTFTVRNPNYIDTLSDLFFDLAGGCVSLLFLVKNKVL